MAEIKKKSEKLLERKFAQRIKKRGGIALKLFSWNFTGLPDRLALLPKGRIFFAEIKTTGKKPTQRQEAVIKQLRNLGFTVFVIDDETSLQKAIEYAE